jgi:ribose transport system substrate-binding protein
MFCLFRSWSLRAGSFRRNSLAIVAAAAVGAGLAGCGSSTGSTTANAGTGSTSTQSSGGAHTGPAASGVAAAEQLIAPYMGHPSAFPVTQRLARIPRGARIAYMDCGIPACALIYQYVAAAAQTMGLSVQRIMVGPAASLAQSGYNTVVAEKPSAVIATAVSIDLWSRQARELEDAKIPVIGAGLLGTQQYGFATSQEAEPASQLEGRLMAAYIAVHYGDKSNVVFYNIPELPFSPIEEAAFLAELKAVCPECSARTDDIPVATLGTTAPSEMVSDLQAHPDTTVAAFTTDEMAIGLPAALRQAGITVKTIGVGPTPINLQYIKAGEETEGLGFDIPVYAWSLVDETAREIIGQKLAGPESQGLSSPLQFLGEADMNFDLSKGWTGYPNYASRFEKLWGVKG